MNEIDKRQRLEELDEEWCRLADERRSLRDEIYAEDMENRLGKYYRRTYSDDISTGDDQYEVRKWFRYYKVVGVGEYDDIVHKLFDMRPDYNVQVGEWETDIEDDDQEISQEEFMNEWKKFLDYVVHIEWQ